MVGHGHIGSRTAACKSHGNAARRDYLRHCRCGNGEWRLQVPLRRGILHYRRTESQFLSPDLAGTTQSSRNRFEAWPRHRLR